MTDLRNVEISWTGNGAEPALDFQRRYLFGDAAERDVFLHAALSDANSGGWFQPKLAGMEVVITYARLDEPGIRAIGHVYGGPSKPAWDAFHAQVAANAARDGVRLMHRGVPLHGDEQERRALAQGHDDGVPRHNTLTELTLAAQNRGARRVYSAGRSPTPFTLELVHVLTDAFRKATHGTSIFVQPDGKNLSVTLEWTDGETDPVWGPVEATAIEVLREQYDIALELDATIGESVN